MSLVKISAAQILDLKKGAVPSPSPHVKGHIIVKSLAKEIIGVSVPTFNAFLKRHSVTHLDHPNGDKGVLLEELVEALGSTAVLQSLDEIESSEAVSIPELTEDSPLNSLEKATIVRAMSFAMEHELVDQFKLMVKSYSRLAELGDD